MQLAEMIRSHRRLGPVFQIKGQSFGFQGEARPSLEAVELQLRRQEAKGAPVKDLAQALMDAYQEYFPEFRGLSCGFRHRDELSPKEPRMAIWALTTLRDGWRVLDHLGTTPVDILLYLLECWPPSVWMDDMDRLRVPQGIRSLLEPMGLVFRSQPYPLDLRWLGSTLASGLSITGPFPSLKLPAELTCRGDIRIEKVDGLQTIHKLSAPGMRMILRDCPDLECIEVPAATALDVRSCPRLNSMRGRVEGNLLIEDCHALRSLEAMVPRDAIPAPSITVRRCESLVSVGQFSGVHRVCQDLVLEDCPKLERVDPRLKVRWERRIRGCPRMEEHNR